MRAANDALPALPIVHEAQRFAYRLHGAIGQLLHAQTFGASQHFVPALRYNSSESEAARIMIQITETIAIDESELDEEFVRSAGPGGQNVNKVETAVQLRFDAAASPSLPDDVRSRLMALAGHRLTDEGVIVILARRARTQAENRQAAHDQLVRLIQRAAQPPALRRATRLPVAARAQRLESKRRRSGVKRSRRQPPPDLES